MSYIDVNELKRWLNVEESWTADDLVMAEIIEGAEAAITAHLARKSLAELEDETTHDIPADLKVAIKSLAATSYSNRESISFAEAKRIPYTMEYLIQKYKEYDKTKYNQ